MRVLTREQIQAEHVPLTTPDDVIGHFVRGAFEELNLDVTTPSTVEARTALLRPYLKVTPLRAEQVRVRHDDGSDPDVFIDMPAEWFDVVHQWGVSVVDATGAVRTRHDGHGDSPLTIVDLLRELRDRDSRPWR